MSAAINGNVSVGKGAKLSLGCTFGYHDCGFVPNWLENVIVNGNIDANQALPVYLDFTTIHGNVISNGGGDIHDGRRTRGSLPIKDDVSQLAKAEKLCREPAPRLAVVSFAEKRQLVEMLVRPVGFIGRQIPSR